MKKKKAAMMSSPNILAASFHFLTFFLLFTFFTSMNVLFTHHHSINYLQWQTKQNPILPLQLFLCFFFYHFFFSFSSSSYPNTLRSFLFSIYLYTFILSNYNKQQHSLSLFVHDISYFSQSSKTNAL